jgi:hypothetical protein
MQRAGPNHVRFGSEADIEARPRDVRFTLESRHQERILKLVSTPASAESHRRLRRGRTGGCAKLTWRRQGVAVVASRATQMSGGS